MSGSKTKYYVASSCFPIFDPDKRMDHFQAALLDYTSNSPIELYEYMKRYYDNSRLRNYRGYLNWCDTKGFTKTFGKINSIFYGNPAIDNSAVTEALKPHISLEPNDVFSVYQTNLNFFSEDFFVRYLATQQGHADWVYQQGDSNYTIEYTSNTHLVATFEDGRVIEGDIPVFALNARFLEISYSIIRETQKIDPVTEVITKEYKYLYGFYHYQEDTGIPELDAFIIDNGIEGGQTYYPVIPLRTNTAWYGGNSAKMIASALEYLQIAGERTEGMDCYDEIKDACVKGMTSGSIGDIDYITMILGVAINSQEPADQRYLYDFFFNIYANYALKEGFSPTQVYTAKSLTSGNNYLGKFADGIVSRFNECGHNDSYYKSFTLNCASSNLNYTFSWGSADYFEANGKFKPDAKYGDYGVLSGSFTHVYYTYRALKDNEGNLIIIDGEIQYEVETHYVPYTLVLFCHQYSETRWRFTLFVDLQLRNLIYHGKSIVTKAHDANMDAAATASVTHNFYEDFPSAPGEYHQFTFRYITAAGDPDTAFIVPLEQETFREIGVVNQLNVSYGSQFLVFNCWVKKKIKWYQRGWFSVALSFVGMVVSFAFGFQMLGTFFATVFAITFTAVNLELTVKVLQMIFGDRLGLKIYNFALSLVSMLATYVAKCIPYFGWLIGMAIMFTVTAADAYRQGVDLWEAMKQGVIAGAAWGASYQIAQGTSGITDSMSTTLTELGLSEAVSGAVTEGAVNFGVSTTTNLLQGKSFSESIKAGITSGVLSGLGNFVRSDTFIDFVKEQGFTDLADFLSPEISTGSSTEALKESTGLNFKDYLMQNVIQNPFTYEKMLQMTLEELNFHKLENLENDYQEFSNAAAQAQRTLQTLMASQNSTTTAEFVCKLQANLGRLLTLFPDSVTSMSPENFLNIATSVNGIIHTGASNVSTFVDGKLYMEGYSPYTLYYNQVDPSLVD